MDEISGAGGPVPEPGWLDDPFHRNGQRWWDGRQWTARTRSVAGEPPRRSRPPTGRPRRSAPDPMPARAIAGSSTSSRRALRSPRSHTLVIIGILLAFTIVGLVAPSAEESGVASEGYRRAAYWSCADLLTQQLGPSVDLEFPGDSTAAVTNEGQTWDVSGRVDIVSEQEPVARTWRCTIAHDGGVWRGIAALE